MKFLEVMCDDVSIDSLSNRTRVKISNAYNDFFYCFNDEELKEIIVAHGVSKILSIIEEIEKDYGEM